MTCACLLEGKLAATCNLLIQYTEPSKAVRQALMWGTGDGAEGVRERVYRH